MTAGRSPLQRGAVYLCQIQLPNRSGTGPVSRALDKLLVVLQGGPPFADCSEVAVVVASTWRRGSPRPFEVVMGTADGFLHDTVVDCRWPYTLPKAQVVSGRHMFTLPSTRMHQLSLALVRGLQLS